MTDKIMPNSVGWYILEGHPWWPVYVCDVTKLRPNLHLLGNGHRKILKKARDFPSHYIVVYYFGSHDFSLVGLKKGVLRPWECAEKHQFLKGHPKHLIKKKGVIEELLDAVHEAEEYLSQPEDVRLPQYMVPSDLDPTLEPPPELVPPEMDEEGEMMDMDDADEEQEEDCEMEKKKKKMDEKKRKRMGDQKSASSAKKIRKVSQEIQVKSELGTEKKKDSIEKKPPPADMTTEALSILLEKEIRWILVNCVFEEMTTKTVRKLLEDRLEMDLRHHKASIKEGVARVIMSMEKEDVGDSSSTIPEESTAASMENVVPFDVKVENETAALVTPEVVVEQADGAAKEEAARTEKTESTKKELEAASKNLSLALELEPKIIDALSSLKSLNNVDENVLAASTLQTRLVKLRAHPSSKICELVGYLVKKWDVEELVPAPKPITKKEILDLKAKLENSETIHDELLVTLNQLGEMAVTIDHLKKTRIARAVSKLRQHGNDKVSAKAHELRQKWIKQSNEQPADSDSGSNPLKTLKTLNRILGQQSDGTDEQKLQSKQLVALEQLHSMSLDTKDIIDSKVGIPVSKLRKSSNEKVAKLAKKLRKKWQAEAKA
ncbi:unnamed protein product [Peronospora destructor]|uniref:TFIIS N-terminal domain-containing protein n=1 Tax=Peronospora destructor TaxID=86335 RepID=A0AAV0V0Y3_9STRA|nr:unnamed protein product [Peronospora destructor]